LADFIEVLRPPFAVPAGGAVEWLLRTLTLHGCIHAISFKRLLMKTLLSILLLGVSMVASAADQTLWEKSTLNQVMKRGELRVGLEAGYMP
jgi:hypothetical protein